MLAHAYEYVCEIEKYRNISRAAASLCITQPALTKYINRLEQELGVKLFERSSNPISLTDAGKKFAEKAHVILNMERELLEDLGQISASPQGKLTVGLTTETCSLALPFILPRFQQMYPNIKLQLVEGSNRRLTEELLKERVEIILIASGTPLEQLMYECIQEEAIILAVPSEHRLAQTYDLTVNSPLTPYYLNPEEIRGEDFVVCAPELGMGMFAYEMFKKYDIRPHIVLEMHRNEAAVRMASTGVGMVFTPVRTPSRIPLMKPMVYFSLESPIYKRKRCLCYRREIPLSEPAQYFIPLMKKIFKEEPELRETVCQLIYRPQK